MCNKFTNLFAGYSGRSVRFYVFGGVATLIHFPEPNTLIVCFCGLVIKEKTGTDTDSLMKCASLSVVIFKN